MGLSLVLSQPVRGQGAETAIASICLLAILDAGPSASSLVQLQVHAPASGSPPNPPSSRGMTHDAHRQGKVLGNAHPLCPRAGRALLPSLPPPDSWPAQAVAAAPPHPLSGVSLAPGQRQTVGMRMMLGDKGGKGEGAASGLGYIGEHISSVLLGPISTHQGM